jgi:hypothetical protein
VLGRDYDVRFDRGHILQRREKSFAVSVPLKVLPT